MKQGIVVQRTVPYAHQQAGKIERYIRTIEEGGQTLLADSGLSMSFWGWAVLTSQYLRNRLPTSTLPVNVTPFEALTSKKPDLSHLRVWGCQCFVTIPSELRSKAGPRRFEAIFIGYVEARIGWLVRDMKGKVHFSRDVIFNEDLSGRMSLPRSISPHPPDLPSSPSTRPIRDRIRTVAGRDFDAVLRLRKLRAVERAKRNGDRDVVEKGGTNGGADMDVDMFNEASVAVAGISTNGGANVGAITDNGGAVAVDEISTNGGAEVDVIADNDHLDVISDDTLVDLVSLAAYSAFPNPIETSSLVQFEHESLWNHCFAVFPPIRTRNFDLSQAPQSYAEAMARSDAASWRAAMEREKTSLTEMGAFEEVDLPAGAKTIGLKWVYAYKKNAEGMNILEKARVVAQGFNQRPGQFDETYAPVAKMTSVRVLLTWAAVKDLEIYQFDCKTAFLHAKIRHPNYARQFPGYTFSNPNKVLRILVALYGL
jgi:hypothetical protein